jgi:Tfp pilus assembly protein PilF
MKTLNKSRAPFTNRSLYFLFVFIIPVLIYLPSLRFGFVDFDDDQLILKNIDFLGNPHNISRVFFTNAFIGSPSSFYRPMQTLSYMLDLFLTGGKAIWIYHFSNVLYIGAIAVLLYALLIQFSIPRLLAFWGATIYCIHPLFVSSIAWIPARGDLQLTFFTLLSFLMLTYFKATGKIKYFVFHWISFSLALFCKETAALLPFLFLAYYLSFGSSTNIAKTVRNGLFLYLPIWVFWFWMRYLAIGAISRSTETLSLHSIFTSLRIVPESLSKFFIPFNNAPIPGFSAFKTISGIIVIGILILLMRYNKERPWKEKLFCLIWFVLLMAPALVYKSPLFDYLDHRFLTPMIGILLLILFFISEKWIKSFRSPLPITAFSIISIVFLCLTYHKAQVYSDSQTFYNSAVSQNPSSAIAFNNRGQLLLSQGKLKDATKDFSHALLIKSDYEDALVNRGVAYNRLGMIDQAIADLLEAIRLSPGYAEAYNNLGASYYSLGVFDMAIKNFTSAIKIRPDYVDAFYNRALSYDAMGLFDKEITDGTKLIELRPDYAEAYITRGIGYLRIQANNKACLDFSNAANLGNVSAKQLLSKYCGKGASVLP